MSRFESMVNKLAAYQCRQAGQSYERIAKSAGRSVRTIQRWVSVVRTAVRIGRSYP